MKIIFLDIDGVLNCQNTFKESIGYRICFNKYFKYNSSLDNLLTLKLLDIDYNKLMLLKQITDLTNAKIVVISSWRKLSIYNLVEQYLIKLGIPIIDAIGTKESRGNGINRYIKENNITNYIILDDEIFDDYTEENKYNLIRTNFYQEGLNEESVINAINILNYKEKEQDYKL